MAKSSTAKKKSTSKKTAWKLAKKSTAKKKVPTRKAKKSPAKKIASGAKNRIAGRKKITPKKKSGRVAAKKTAAGKVADKPAPSRSATGQGLKNTAAKRTGKSGNAAKPATTRKITQQSVAGKKPSGIVGNGKTDQKKTFRRPPEQPDSPHEAGGNVVKDNHRSGIPPVKRPKNPKEESTARIDTEKGTGNTAEAVQVDADMGPARQAYEDNEAAVNDTSDPKMTNGTTGHEGNRASTDTEDRDSGNGSSSSAAFEKFVPKGNREQKLKASSKPKGGLKPSGKKPLWN
ncbi:MAG: hypothetical protein ABWZ25_03410 [Chitinophagaceae bacterium]